MTTTARNEAMAMPGPQPVLWVVLQPRGIFGIYADEDEAREMARATGSVLTHLPADGDYRQR